ncbi:hypothetical protein EI969_16355 [Pseudomonas sp. PB101]|uniref:flagellar basal body protein n=1 Tax=Pseudomonas sp. PB101 TaxID=2495428 RepID=UPI001DB68DB1|nr:hypothetical protein [Pseudomonas sp. PB101]
MAVRQPVDRFRRAADLCATGLSVYRALRRRLNIISANVANASTLPICNGVLYGRKAERAASVTWVT